MRALDFTDPERVLLTIPGVYVRSEDGYGLHPNIGMRGANSHRSRRITLLQDGVLEAYAPYSSPSIFSLVPMTRVVGIDVIRGPAALLYGPQTIAGAIDFRTREIPEGPTASLDYVFGVNYFSRLHFYAGTSDPHFGVMLEGLYTRSSGFEHIDFAGTSTGFDLGDITMRAFYRDDIAPGVRHRLSVKGTYQLERSNESYVGISDADFRADPYRRYVASALDQMNRQRTQVELRYELEVQRELNITAVAYRSDVTRVWYRTDRFRNGPSIFSVLENPTAPRTQQYYRLLTGALNTPDTDHSFLYVNNDWRYVSEGLQVDARWQHRDGIVAHDVRVGTRIHYDSIDRHIGTDGWNVTGQRLIPDGSPRLSQNEDLAETLAYSAYAMYTLGVGPITAAPGARVEWMHMGFTDRLMSTQILTDMLAVMPGGSIMYDPTSELRFFVGLHRGFTPPPPQDARTTGPETSLNYEVGTRFTGHTHDATVEATAFLSDYDNITSQCTLSAGCMSIDHVFNGGRASIWGAEFAGSYTFDIEQFRIPVQGAYTYTGTEMLTSFQSADPQFGSVHAGDELPYVPQHEASVTLGLVWPEHFGIHVQGLAVGAMREQAGHGSGGLFTDESYLLDIRADVRVVDHVTLFARGENLLAQTAIASRRPWGARPIRPIQVQIGVRIDL